MLQPRIDVETQPPLYAPVAPAPYVFPIVPDDELETPLLPREHPPWIKDALSVSHRMKTFIARMKPVVVRVLGFWDHAVRTITVGARRVSIDASGSYRIE